MAAKAPAQRGAGLLVGNLAIMRITGNTLATPLKEAQAKTETKRRQGPRRNQPNRTEAAHGFSGR